MFASWKNELKAVCRETDRERERARETDRERERQTERERDRMC